MVMTERPFFGDSAGGIAERGIDALERGDRRTCEECLLELRRRSTRAAQAFARELVDALQQSTPKTVGRRYPGAAVSIPGPFDVSFVTDAEIVRVRREMVDAARRNIWLSTYTFIDRDDELTSQLCTKARSGVRVTLIGAFQGPEDSVVDQLNRIEDAGAQARSVSSHSKCVVCDDEFVLIGSANLNRTYRDAAIYVRSADLAAHVIRYLDTHEEQP